ncbi:MAG: arginine--tRNA ligase [Pseudomonadota bacterium]|nr:arginine--tRNA ligase [Pseudomonadota bacterium]
MKEKIKESLRSIIIDLYGSSESIHDEFEISIQDNKENQYGDLASNVALVLAKPLKRNPKEIAEEIKGKFITDKEIVKVDVAGPGFINFFLSKESHGAILRDISIQKDKFGKFESNNKKVLIEYVSSNPTGPLHVGHGRGAVFGSVLSRLLKEAGFQVDEEYYVNDFGRQMNILSVSLWIRYAQIFDKNIKMLNNGYQGDYLIVIAQHLKKLRSDELFDDDDEIKSLLEYENEDAEKHTDEVIDSIKSKLNDEFSYVRDFALREILELIKEDLLEFGVDHNKWFSESSLYESESHDLSKVDQSIDELSSKGFVYEKEGAIWFKSSELGDDKDRVLKRGNGEFTYFASDVAYHLDKYDRGYDRIINIWGSDHHGYLPRVKAAMEASEKNVEKLEVVFIQFANLIRAGKKVTMSTRSGEFITLKELIEEVTSEAARFFYINRKADQHLDFDLDLAKEQSKDNPLYYIQYAHARICSVLRKSKVQEEELTTSELGLLDSNKEIEIQKILKQYPPLIERAALASEPHLICYYLKDLAGIFHSYYNTEKFIVEDQKLMNSRLFLLSGVKQVIYNGLTVLGINAPHEM